MKRARDKTLQLRALGDNTLYDKADKLHSSNIILGVYLIIFGAGKNYNKTSTKDNPLTSIGTALLEFQIPQQVARYASFMFSFLGRGVCK